MNSDRKKLKRIRRWIRLTLLAITLVVAAAGLIGLLTLFDFYQHSTVEGISPAQKPAEDMIYRQDSLGALRLSWEAVSGFTQAIVGVIGTVLSLLSLLLAFLVLYWDKLNERRLQCREIYQQLELASVELFRFECEQAELVGLLWNEGDEAQADLTTAQGYQVRAYTCQILNLFEMAVRFRIDGTMEPDVFGSWVIWMHDLSSASRFRAIWPELRPNYVVELREILDAGVACGDQNPELRRAAFFSAVAAQFDNCPYVLSYQKV